MKLKSMLLGLMGLGVVACGGDMLKDAEAKAKAACECKDLDCVRPYVQWFNEQSLKDKGAAVKALPTEGQATYKGFALAAGECQAKLKNP